jgi:hypothetical protein
MRYIEAPRHYNGKARSLFMAGGVTNCADWQMELAGLLEDERLVVFNPRRKRYPGGERASEIQIKWEHSHLGMASAISFWFTKETSCPITLFELGAWSLAKKTVFIGIDPEYPRRLDVEVQMRIVRPDVKIVYSLESLARQIIAWCAESD